MSSVKEQARQLVDQLSDQATWQDLIYLIYVRQKIAMGIQAGEKGRVQSHCEVKRKFPRHMKLVWSDPAVSDLEDIRD